MAQGRARAKIEAALSKPLSRDEHDIHSETFDPWSDVIEGIHGSYNSEADALFIGALIAVRDGTPFEFVKEHGFAAELTLYVLSGHGLTEYGASPRGAWVDPYLSDLWQPLIDKWVAYYRVVWGEEPPTA